MGRKRKTRWRRLSIGGYSGNEEEEAERESEILGFSKMNPASRLRSGSQPTIVNSYASSAAPFDHSSPSPLPAMNGGNGGVSGKYGGNSGGSAGHSPPESKCSDENSTHGGVNGYSTHSSQNHSHHNLHHHHNGRGEHHHGHNGHGGPHHGNGHGYNNGSGSYGKESRGGEGSYNNGHYHSNGYYPSSNYYHHRNSYHTGNGGGSYRGGGGGYDGYRGRGGGDYHGSRFGGRFRKPRPYASNYYYNNGPSSSGSNEEGTTNRPSYNQEEYTKITTPRQDVLFKKGYLSQRKPVTQSSSVDSTPTTPSTNGTPDTHSTNGINSDYSEGYENGETECGLLPYDDTVYYGLPPETAVFTDPNTGQVYYGQSNGEYFDAYPLSPVMMGGYPTPVYYHLPYPGMDWNGLPTPIYPIVPLGPPPLDDHQPSIQNGETQKSDGSSSNGKGSDSGSADPTVKSARKGDISAGTPTVLTNGTGKNSKAAKKNGGDRGTTNGTLSDSSTSSSREGSTSTFSSAASTPLSPPVNGGQHMTSLAMSMSSMSLVDGQPHLQPIHAAIPQTIPVSHFMAHSVPPPPTHHPHHPQQILYHPHPAAFVYAPPIYNGVVLPIAPVASSAETQSSPSSRKKRKLRRRKKDDGQLTDESSCEEENISATDEPKDSPVLAEENISTINIPLIKSNSSSQQTSSSDTSPFKCISSTTATRKDLLVDEVNCPEIPETITNYIKIETNCFKIISNTDSTVNNPKSIETPSPKDSIVAKISSNPKLNFHLETEQSLLQNKILQSSQIPSDDEEGIVKPEQEQQPTSEGTEVENNPESGVEVANPSPSSEETIHIHSSKKPQDLALGLDLISTPSKEGLEADEVSLSLLLPLTSPKSLEPGSPDSFNTTQSLAGSEIPSVSISETDFMNNRTTSVDEVEEDLPPEEFLLENVQSFDLGRSPKQQETCTSRSLENESDLASRSPSTLQQSDPVSIPTKDRESFDSSPPVTPKDTELSPSPETIFERQLEVPVILPSELNVETQEILNSEPLEALAEELREIVDVIQVDTEPCQQCPSVTATVPQSPASDDANCILIQEPSITYLAVAEEEEDKNKVCSSPFERPQSITLAVAEWLKVQGPDALTPVNQLQELFQEASEDDDDIESESEEDGSLQLTTDDLTKLDSSSGRPKSAGSAPSNCAIQ